jgi:4-amino-4-deoxy-L-arabinose transferase-like glycosyltransferase
VVAGPRVEGAQGHDTAPDPVAVVRGGLCAVTLVWRRAGVLAPLLALYLLAAAALLLPWPFGAHPPWAYNWEGYTVWRWATFWEPPAGPAVGIWAPTDGLMTESGQGPLVGLPVTIGVALAGFTLAAMRVPVTLLAAAAVPLLWLLGRRVVGDGAATLAALLLATSPVFLLYGRTATLVGVSMVPLLLMALALVRALAVGAGEGWRWRREGLLAASLLLGVYAYAPVRLFWPLAVVILGGAALLDPARRSVLLRAALLCAVAVPAMVMALEVITSPHPDPLAAASGYFHARGEQLMAMSENPSEAGTYLREATLPADAGWEAARLLVLQNAVDLVNLLRDYDTGPVPVDYWNQRGRFWPWFFAPFAVAGAVAMIWSALGRQGMRDRVIVVLPVLLAAGLALPLLLTSRVHIGRLAPVLPFAMLIVAAGVAATAGRLARLARRMGAAAAAARMAPILAGALLLLAVADARGQMDAPAPVPRETRMAATIAAWQEEARARGGAVLVEPPTLGDEIERVRAAILRLDLDRVYRFVDLQGEPGLESATDSAVCRGTACRAPTEDADTVVSAAAAASGAGGIEAGDLRPSLYWRGALAALREGAIGASCDRLWFVVSEAVEEFLTAWRSADCTGAPDSVILP